MQSKPQQHWLSIFFMAVTAIIISLSTPVFAKGDVFVNSNGLAIKGYDPVAYFVSSKAIKGKKEFSQVYAGNTWQFSSAANRKAFVANPVAYIPQYGGFCAYAAGKNKLAPIDPKAWTIHNNKLYLNYSLRIRNKWMPNIAKNIAKGDANWPKLALKVKTR